MNLQVVAVLGLQFKAGIEGSGVLELGSTRFRASAELETEALNSKPQTVQKKNPNGSPGYFRTFIDVEDEPTIPGPPRAQSCPPLGTITEKLDEDVAAQLKHASVVGGGGAEAEALKPGAISLKAKS